jgi:uncharacterized protein YbjQ (UPF0145 family)
MIVVTTNDIPGARVARTLGTAFGIVVRSRGIGGNIAASFRSIGGGEITEYTKLVEEARMQAMQRLMGNAHAMGANAVLATPLRFGRDRPVDERSRGLRHRRDHRARRHAVSRGRAPLLRRASNQRCPRLFRRAPRAAPLSCRRARRRCRCLAAALRCCPGLDRV